MLCPETWYFKPPASDFKIEKSDVSTKINSSKINNFHFNHLVSLTVPDTLNLPKSVADTLLIDCEYYKVCDLDPSEFVNATFIDSFVNQGALSLLSVETRIDCDDCLVITPSRKLILSLTKESYQSSGLEGTVSHFCVNNKYKYIVKIDLSNLIPGTKAFDRTKNCLKRLNPFDVILIWEPPDAKICPSSIAKYFDGLNYGVKLCSPKYDAQLKYSVKAPVIDFENCTQDDCADYLEWLGMLVLNADIENGSQADFISTYEVLEPSVTFGQIRILVWRGFFTSKRLELFFNEIMKYQRDNDKPWISLHVQGFSDSPVSWGEREHHYYTNGDNSYTILVNSEKSVTCSSMCSYKRYNKKKKK